MATGGAIASLCAFGAGWSARGGVEAMASPAAVTTSAAVPVASTMPAAVRAPTAAPSCQAIEVHFTPGSECSEADVRVIDAATTSIHLSAYGFTDKAVIAALERAKARGVEVRALLDRSDERKPEGAELAAAGAWVRYDEAHPIAHTKAIVIDRAVVRWGSANFTRQATKNREVCTVVRDAALAARFEQDFEAHAAHSEAR